MIRPLISSLSMLKTETVFSMACSVAVRCIVSMMIFLASVLAVILASSIISFIWTSASVFASSFRFSISWDFASWAERFEILSSFSIWTFWALSRSDCFLFTISTCPCRFCLMTTSSFCFLASSSTFWLTEPSFCLSRFSFFEISSFFS